MLINSLAIHNIKSYGEPGCVIDFKPGVNLIWGENGAGKTTILEAIGYCLFGAIDYDLDQFKREGCSDGDLTLTFEAQDQRQYQVIRSLKSSASLKIYDCQLGRTLISKRTDAEDWLTDQLGIEFGKYSKTLFRNALGVAQGKMTGSFLEDKKTRKTIFDPILKVDEYETAWSKLSDTGSELKGQVSIAKEVEARLTGKLERLPAVKTRLQKLQESISAAEIDLQQTQVELDQLKANLYDMDQSEKAINEVERKFTTASLQLQAAAEKLVKARKDWDDAVIAVEMIQKCL
jgi:DNA repair protein SbcC/Rad50